MPETENICYGSGQAINLKRNVEIEISKYIQNNVYNFPVQRYTDHTDLTYGKN